MTMYAKNPQKNEEKTDAVAVAPATLVVVCREQGVTLPDHQQVHKPRTTLVITYFTLASINPSLKRKSLIPYITYYSFLNTKHHKITFAKLKPLDADLLCSTQPHWDGCPCRPVGHGTSLSDQWWNVKKLWVICQLSGVLPVNKPSDDFPSALTLNPARRRRTYFHSKLSARLRCCQAFQKYILHPWTHLNQPSLLVFIWFMLWKQCVPAVGPTWH